LGQLGSRVGFRENRRYWLQHGADSGWLCVAPFLSLGFHADFSKDWAFQNFPGDTYIKANQVDYLDKAIGWASNHGLKVWIDLHGAPGSQNGYDNSGHNGTAGWSTPDTTSATRSVIQQIANRYAKNQATVIGIELLNEPLLSKLPGGSDALYQYYKDGFGDVRVVSDTPVVIHDAFQSASALNGVLPASSGDQNVIVDHHEYQCFTDAMVLEPQDVGLPDRVSYTVNFANRLHRHTSLRCAPSLARMRTTQTIG